jgi:hypothetical protein
MGRMTWRRLFPAAVATAVCGTGLGVFSALLFSGQIVSGEADYGPIGVVTVLLSYLIGLAVFLHLGTVAGRMWNEPGPQPIADPSELRATTDERCGRRSGACVPPSCPRGRSEWACRFCRLAQAV